MHYITMCVITFKRGGVMKNSFSVLGIILLISFISIGGCGGSSGGGEPCDFNLNGILNGPNFDQATSEWECNGPANEFAFYQDGTGRDFSVLTTYQRVGCNTINFQDEFVEGVYIDLEGSKASNFLSFTRIVGDAELFLECTLRIFEDDDEFF